ncbi:MAG: glycosyl transferase [Gammaproteobacteria bacterium]|nr:glycosyl transferase [Gammaproteobacteria bacterium]
MAGVFIYVQHLLGSGHLHRMARIAHELARTGVPVTLCSGGMPVRALRLPASVRFVQLEPLHCAPDDFTRLLDSRDQDLDGKLRGQRLAQLFAALADSAPRVALIESFPFARRQMRFELKPLLKRLRELSIPTVCSIRDILQVKSKAGRELETLALLTDYFAAVLVHGDRRVVELQATFKHAAQIACDVHYTGYVAGPAAVSSSDEGGAAEIVVSAGGGAVGYPLFRAALDACRAGCQADKRWRFLLGGGLDAEQGERLRADAPANARITPVSESFTRLLQSCSLSISQAGYNTVVDVLQAGCRGLLVPYAQSGEMEQTLRTQRLQEMGLIGGYTCQPLSAARLAVRVDELIAQPVASADPPLNLHGARNTVALLQTLMCS